MELNKNLQYAGPSFEELSIEEMERIQGSGDVQPETTPFCVGYTVGIGIGALVSVATC